MEVHPAYSSHSSLAHSFICHFGSEGRFPICSQYFQVCFNVYCFVAYIKSATVNIAIYSLLNRAPNAQTFSSDGVHSAIKLLIFTAVVFRSEVAVLLAPILLQSWIYGRTTLVDIMKVGFASGLKAIGRSRNLSRMKHCLTIL